MSADSLLLFRGDPFSHEETCFTHQPRGALGASPQTLCQLYGALASMEEGDQPPKRIPVSQKYSSSMAKRSHTAQGPQTPQSCEPGSQRTDTHLVPSAEMT